MSNHSPYYPIASLILAVALSATNPWTANGQSAAPDTVTAPLTSAPSQMHTLAPIVIKGKEFTTRELVQRAMQGERSKMAGHADATYRITTHFAMLWDDKKDVENEVTRVYGDSTGYTRRVLLAVKGERFKKKDGAWVFEKNIDANNDSYRIRELDEGRFTNVPVYLEKDEEFNFAFVERTIEGNRVIFHVSFKPKSDFSEMPSGEIWVDGDGFRVVHEIYDFTKNPFPLLIKGVRRISVQWMELPAGEWVPRQFAAEVDIRGMPFMPRSISFKQTWEDFRFDLGYDERLFGKRDAEPVAIAPRLTPEPAAAGVPATAVADTSATMAPDSLDMGDMGADVVTSVDGKSGYLATLQQQDNAAYSSDVDITNQAFIDSTAALHDSLGVAGLSGDMALYGSEWRLGFDPRLTQWDYNRVEGFLFGGAASYGRADNRSKLSLWGGYATGSEEFRYRGDFKAEIPGTDRKLSLALSGKRMAEAFGSNQVAVNSLRAFVGGADEQDYLESTGGAARLVCEPWDDVSFDAGYEFAQERSLGASEDFSLFGDMDEPNPPVTELDEHALVAGFTLEGRRWLNARITQRLAQGETELDGADFDYARTEIRLNARGFVLGRQEFDLTLKGVTTGGSKPFQKLADIGGLSTVRGYDRRTHVGNHSFAARLEYLFPYDVFAATNIPLLEDAGIQFIPWGDAGRVGEGDSQDWITSAGVGLQRYLWPFGNAANIRLDFAWPFDNPEDDFAVYLWFTALR